MCTEPTLSSIFANRVIGASWKHSGSVLENGLSMAASLAFQLRNLLTRQ